MFDVLNVEQRSEAWHAARLGRLTGSRAAAMLATVKSGEAAARRNLRVQLVLERLTGKSQEREFQTVAMLNGIDREPEALQLYEATTGVTVQRSGFLAHRELMAGASLDGHLGAFEVVVEVKSPMPASHLEYLRSGVVPKDYVPQLLHALWLTGAREAHFVSYSPVFPDRMQLQVAEMARDNVAIALYEKALRKFLAEVDAETASIATMYHLEDRLAASVR
jgi:hypothetical protein